MPILLNCQDLSKSYGPHPLFNGVSLGISSGERLGLIGPNGAGKSTLMKILAGRVEPDTGEITRTKGLHAAYVEQADVFAPGATPISAVAESLIDPWGDSTHAADADDAHDLYERETRAALTLSKVGFDDLNQSVDELSGGWRKRLSIARELAKDPELLLLDEPTNHLDLEGIVWLEQMLGGASFGVIVVTHDRYFLENATTRIVELSHAYPNGTFDIDGPYSTFLDRRDDYLASQAEQQRSLNNQVRKDNEWLARGAKARRTKAKSRIEDSSNRMQQLAELKRRNAPAGATAIDFNATGRKTKNLLVAHNIAKAYDDKPLFAKLDLTLSPGTRIGLLGPNGSGKTTLINTLIGELAPDTGTVKPAVDLRIVTFTQRREELDRTISLRDALCPESDSIIYRGKPVHVATWAQKFLFRKDQMNVPVGDLSGGEQARILIAELMCKEADLLILDEPTNDLDIPSLEVLEQSLEEFPGAVVLVTHDRFMLARLATDVLGLDGHGNAKLFASYDQWEAAQKQTQKEAKATKPKSAVEATDSPAPAGGDAPKKLNYNETRELGQIEDKIAEAEAVAEKLQAGLDDPALLADHEKMTAHCTKLGDAQAEVARLYARWEELESRA